MKNYINTPEQRESDKFPEINPEVTEIYNLSDRQFKIVVIKKLNELQENSENSMNAGIQLMSRRNSSPKR